MGIGAKAPLPGKEVEPVDEQTRPRLVGAVPAASASQHAGLAVHRLHLGPICRTQQCRQAEGVCGLEPCHARTVRLRSELASADRVDLLCAFIRWHGLRVMELPLLAPRDRGVPFRVMTTTYMGATERRAADELVRRFRVEVRIYYETQSTRLHSPSAHRATR
jgi:hypothetical protein